MAVTYDFEIDSSHVPSDLTDFPVRLDLANLSTAIRDDLAANIDASGNGFRVKDSGGTVLDYTLENFSNAGSTVVGELVFRCSPTSASNLGLKLTADSALSNNENQSGVYASAYDAGWNFEQDPSGTAPQLTDITGNGYDGTTTGSMTSGDKIPGILGSCWDFDGTDDDVPVGNWPSATTDTWSVLFWVWADTSPSTGMMLFNNDAGGYDDSFQLGLTPETTSVNTNDRFAINHQDTASSVRTIAEDDTNVVHSQWYQVACTSDGSNLKLYVDGVLKDTTAKVGTYLNVDSKSAVIGKRAGATSRLWNGRMNEGFAKEAALSADWIEFDHLNMTESDNCLVNWAKETAGGIVTPYYYLAN